MTIAMLILLLFQASGGTLAGRLVDYNTRKPIDGAKIILLKTTYEARTDKNGESMLPNIAPGTYQFEIIHPTYPGGGPKTVVVKKDSITRADYSMIRIKGPSVPRLEADTSTATNK